jgi:hypothetical protein
VKRWLPAAALAAAVLDVHAGRPMITDDARLLEARSCQLEAWTRRTRDEDEYWALPACNFTGNLELTFGGARTRNDEGSAFTENVLQAKTILKPLEAGGWGLGFTLGTVRHPRREKANGWPGDTYLTVPVSVSLMDERWTAHFNGGMVYRRDEKRTVPTWGFANEVQLRGELYLIPEIFHIEPGRPFYQVALRYMIVKDRVQVDATYGNRMGSENEHWISIGLRLQTPPFIR